MAISNDAAVSVCSHKRTQTVAKDSESQYEECLDCGAVLEADELQANELQHNELQANALPANASQRNPPAFHESLSDA
jgi:transcription initiation factor TFIIIB Brf1 subunit/transcription initiation factor TFIIB